MKQRFQHCFKWAALLLVPVLIGSGCVESATTGFATAEAIIADATVESVADASTIPADLTAVEIIVQRLRPGDPDKELQKDETVDIKVDDRISVEEQGRGLLRFQDRLQVEVFRETELQLAEVRLDTGDLAFVGLRQLVGHTRTELDEKARARVKLETEYATISALDGGTVLLVCHAEALTCVATLEGKAEIEAQDQVVTSRAGQATYIFPGEPPQPVIDIDPEEFRQWLDRKRGTEDVEPLGALVIATQERLKAATSAGSSTSTEVDLPLPTDMVRIDNGLYRVGSNEADEFHTPSQEITVPKFWIDQYEVTNDLYQAFIEEQEFPPPVNWPGEQKHPVKGVTWDEAAAYCDWANKRLPTEAEWEVAARGPGSDPPLYPWGSDQEAGGQVSDLPRTGTYEVGTMPFNKSPFDVYDLAGNVWEWVGDPYGPVPNGQKILRGGRHGLLKDMAYRQPAEPDHQSFVPVAGFRCAADRVMGE